MYAGCVKSKGECGVPGFYIIGSSQQPPVSRKSIFTDGTLFRSSVRTVVHPRFVCYHIPEEQLSTSDVAKALNILGINDQADGSVWLYPQAKYKFDREKVQLISISVKDG